MNVLDMRADLMHKKSLGIEPTMREYDEVADAVHAERTGCRVGARDVQFVEGEG